MAQKKRLLIIDDEENLRHLLRSILEKEGYEVCLAADGQQGLALLEEQDFDMILCDLRMPRMDGIEFLKQAAGRTQHRHHYHHVGLWHHGSCH